MQGGRPGSAADRRGPSGTTEGRGHRCDLPRRRRTRPRVSPSVSRTTSGSSFPARGLRLTEGFRPAASQRHPGSWPPLLHLGAWGNTGAVTPSRCHARAAEGGVGWAPWTWTGRESRPRRRGQRQGPAAAPPAGFPAAGPGWSSRGAPAACAGRGDGRPRAEEGALLSFPRRLPGDRSLLGWLWSPDVLQSTELRAGVVRRSGCAEQPVRAGPPTAAGSVLLPKCSPAPLPRPPDGAAATGPWVGTNCPGNEGLDVTPLASVPPGPPGPCALTVP